MRCTFLLTGVFTGLCLANSLAALQPPPGRGGGGFRGGTAIKDGESCPPGTTEVRPRTCLGPETPAPSILDYRPKSTLVAPVTMVKTAKFPAIDFHGHPGGLLATTESLARLGASLDSLNVRMMIAADNMSGDRLKRVMDTLRASPKMKDRVRVLTGISFQNVGPGWAEKSARALVSARASPTARVSSLMMRS